MKICGQTNRNVWMCQNDLPMFSYNMYSYIVHMCSQLVTVVSFFCAQCCRIAKSIYSKNVKHTYSLTPLTIAMCYRNGLSILSK